MQDVLFSQHLHCWLSSFLLQGSLLCLGQGPKFVLGSFIYPANLDVRRGLLFFYDWTLPCEGQATFGLFPFLIMRHAGFLTTYLSLYQARSSENRIWLSSSLFYASVHLQITWLQHFCPFQPWEVPMLSLRPQAELCTSFALPMLQFANCAVISRKATPPLVKVQKTQSYVELEKILREAELREH